MLGNIWHCMPIYVYQLYLYLSYSDQSFEIVAQIFKAELKKCNSHNISKYIYTIITQCTVFQNTIRRAVYLCNSYSLFYLSVIFHKNVVQKKKKKPPNYYDRYEASPVISWPRST